MSLEILLWFIFLSLLTSLSIFDLKTYRLPNWLLGAGVFFALCFLMLQGTLEIMKLSLLGGVVGILLLIVPFGMRVLGAGDVKFLGMIGLFLGPLGTFMAFLLASIAGGLFLVPWVLYQQKRTAENTSVSFKQRVPYGMALAIGGLGGALWHGFVGGIG